MSREYVQQRLAQIESERGEHPQVQRERKRKRELFAVVDGMRMEAKYAPNEERLISEYRVIKRETGPYKIAADVWAPPTVPEMFHDDAYCLPEVTRSAQRAGVYFLWLEKRLQYIGSSMNVRRRVCLHDCYKETIFDRATFLAVPWPWHLSLEAYYIRQLKPRWNSTHANGPWKP